MILYGQWPTRMEEQRGLEVPGILSHGSAVVAGWRNYKHSVRAREHMELW
jgi:hypothetical protein